MTISYPRLSFSVTSFSPPNLPSSNQDDYLLFYLCYTHARVLILSPVSPTWYFLAFYLLLLDKCFPCCCFHSTPCFRSFGCDFSTPPLSLGSFSSFPISPPLRCRHLNFRLPERVRRWREGATAFPQKYSGFQDLPICSSIIYIVTGLRYY